MKLKTIITAAASWFSRKLNEIKLRIAIRKAEKMAAKRIKSVKDAYPGCEGAMNANSWPPVDGTTTGYDETGGVTTVRWGTDGLLQSPKPSSGFYVVNSFRQSVDQDLEYLPNGSGIKAGLITLTHGYKWECTVRDDTQMSAPAAGSTVNITDAGGIVIAAHRSTGSAAVGSVFAARVVNPDYSAAPKQPGERVLFLEALLLIDGTSGKLVPVVAV